MEYNKSMNGCILEKNKLKRKATKIKQKLRDLSVDLNKMVFVDDIIALMQYNLGELRYILFEINSLDTSVSELELLTKVQQRLKKKRRTNERLRKNA
jgi:hypothetical protein